MISFTRSGVAFVFVLMGLLAAVPVTAGPAGPDPGGDPWITVFPGAMLVTEGQR